MNRVHEVLYSVLLETRQAFRRLLMVPVFTMTAILTLALGIGVTTSIFTLIYAILLRPLPVRSPIELHRVGRETHCCYISGYRQDPEFSLVSYDLYKYLQDKTQGFSELAAMPSVQALFGVRRSGSAEAAETYPGEFVSGNYFSMFGITTFAGRPLTSDDDQPGAPPVAVMSYRLWQQRYGGDGSVIGSEFSLDEKRFTVVGIAPPAFFGDTLRATPSDFFLPLNTEPLVETDADLHKYDTHWLNLIGRIKPGVAPVSVEAEMRVGLQQWLRSHFDEMSVNERAKLSAQTLNLSPGGAGITSMRERYEHWLRILMMASGFVLLIVCANISNLMLVRGMEHRPQISLSIALGAQRSRVVRQPLIESVLLSLSGGTAGLGIAFICTRLVLRLTFPAVAGLGTVPIGASPSIFVLLFAFATSLLTGIAFSIVPAWIAVRIDPIEALRGVNRSTAVVNSLPQKMLVVVQAAIALVLLSVSGLLTTALHNLENQDFGFEQEGRLVVNINPRLAGYQASQLPALYRRIHDSIIRIPSVASAALCLNSPQGAGGWGSGVWIDGHPNPGSNDNNFASWNRVTAGYFGVVGTPVIKGRGISEQDTANSPKIAVVNEAFAKTFFRNEDPIGKHFGRRPQANREFEIVGVIRDARYSSYNLDKPVAPSFFLPVSQAEYERTDLGSLYLHDIVILNKRGTSAAASEVRQAMASVDSNMPVISMMTLKEQVSSQFSQQRLIARLTSSFAVLSLVLASIGLYGVTAYNAGRRVNEIGVRLALGAKRHHVVAAVVGGACWLIVLGLLFGLPLAFGAARLLGALLYGTNPYDLNVAVTAALALGLSAMIASLIPAARACRISPSEAFRAQ